MTINVVCYGVRPNEVEYFEKLNTYGFKLNLVEALLTHDNIETAKGMEAVILRGNCVADAQNVAKMAEYGVKYLFTRTVGFNHIDLHAAKQYGMKVARVPFYSPNAIAELALTMAMSLLRHVSYTVNRTANYNFKVDATMFSKEIRNCNVGIIGTGRIGLTEAKLFKGLGAKVYGYDVMQSVAAKEVLKFLSLEELLKTCDIISIHVPYFAGQNDQMINENFLNQMKDGAILINTSRGELQDNLAILNALKSNKLSGFGTDVFANETEFFFKEFAEGSQIPDPVVKELVDLYPRVLVTPHIGSNTDEALKNMIETSYENLYDVLETGKSVNEIDLTNC